MSPTRKQREKIRASAEARVASAGDPHPNSLSPLFSLSKLLASAADDKVRAMVFDHLAHMSLETWQQVTDTLREGSGFELIEVERFSRRVQRAVPQDQKKLLVFRCSDVVRRIGYRIEQVYYVVLVDPTHNSY